MERMYDENCSQERKNSRTKLAWILIGVGLICLFRRTVFGDIFPDGNIHILTPIFDLFRSLIHCIFSWPFILLVIGFILLVGRRRSGGLLLLTIGAIFLFFKIFFISGLLFLIFFPVALIVLGFILILHLL